MVGCARTNPETETVPELLSVSHVQEKQDLLESNKELLQVRCGALMHSDKQNQSRPIQTSALQTSPYSLTLTTMIVTLVRLRTRRKNPSNRCKHDWASNTKNCRHCPDHCTLPIPFRAFCRMHIHVKQKGMPQYQRRH